MSNSPEIEWLRRKWNLPETSVGAVARLLEEEAAGSTACVLEGLGTKWGHAALEPDAVGASPLVVVRHDGRDFLQSRRFHETERRIAHRLLSMSAEVFAAPGIEPLLATLFPGADLDDRQAAAAHMALTRKLAVITGGPGTGKTYTLARVLALLSESGVSSGLIRLTAPTGKAAERMKKAVIESLAGLPESFAEARGSLAEVAQGSSTIHSLLGYNPGSGRARFDAKSPLSCSALIVDECSMIDALLWRALLEALPPHCRLILLGDPNQLESVGQGNVFAELARVAGSLRSPLHPCHVHLTEARRFKERPGILELAEALERSDADGTERLLQASVGSGADRGIAWLGEIEGVLKFDHFPAPIMSALEQVATASTPRAALEALNQVCVLTAQREYFVGAKAMSAAIDAAFALRGDVRNHPIIIDHNDPETGLRNGTVGVIHQGEDGKRKAYFPSSTEALLELALARLPDFSPAWAITIHRSQGSEYENVLVVLPHEESPLATRELLYTAITRARRNVFIAGSLLAIRKAVLTPSTRTTLLSWHLGGSEQEEELQKVGELLKEETKSLRTGELFPEWGI